MAPKYKLIYFPVKGLAEPIRFLFAYLGEDFEDYRFNREDWPRIKQTTPWGKSPVLEVDGKAVSQSIAICRYLAKEAGLCGADHWEDLRIDEIVDSINDLRAELAKVAYESDEKRKTALRVPLVNEIVPFYMRRLNDIVKNNNGYLANKKLSWADLYFAAILDYLSHIYGSDLTSGYPYLKALKDKVYTIPRIKTWIDRRPDTDH
ncbi:glutathione S-transferase-like [Macrosteles quadrilineatus]|uniref:glutathione S-transferase-like n=1 Tax=Macrosteles quadrilineatus TaxID=74068 RepID=UPI0023E28B33|nr:glutathione S-transferase-like [Macrosteles quadrilineatus]